MEKKTLSITLNEEELKALDIIKNTIGLRHRSEVFRILIKNYSKPKTISEVPIINTDTKLSKPKLAPTPECIRMSEVLGFEPLKEGNRIYGMKPNGDKVLYRITTDPTEPLKINEEGDITEVYFAVFWEEQLMDIYIKPITKYNDKVNNLKLSGKPLEVDSDWFIEVNDKNKVWSK